MISVADYPRPMQIAWGYCDGEHGIDDPCGRCSCLAEAIQELVDEEVKKAKTNAFGGLQGEVVMATMTGVVQSIKNPPDDYSIEESGNSVAVYGPKMWLKTLVGKTVTVTRNAGLYSVMVVDEGDKR